MSQQLKYLITMLTWSINEAAKNLYLQPTLSKAIKELEKEMVLQFYSAPRQALFESDGAASQLRQTDYQQVELLENKYLDTPYQEQLLSVSTQHYSFSVDAMVRMIEHHGGDISPLP